MDTLSIGSHRLVHLDLKGCPLHVLYLEDLFPLLRSWGVTGLLVEWEDTFPYSRELSLLGSNGPTTPAGAYTVEEARLLLQLAGDAGLMVMPLVQTFGHLEFVLKHDKWKHLREVEAYPSSMCPSHPDALPLVTSMIKQIVEFHPDIQYLHIGADEVWHMGLCATCSQRVKCLKGRWKLFLEHVAAVAQFVRDTYPNLIVIMWDDMLRPMDVGTLSEYNLGQLVEPMVWHYPPAEAFSLPDEVWDRYSAVFTHLWAATAFKGATGGRQLIPVIRHHISNHEHWLRVLGTHAGKFRAFRGVVLTGWSRYDHYAALCELLPAALPSLLLCLQVWLTGSYSPQLHESVAKRLGYDDEAVLSLDSTLRPQPVAQKLCFPGWKVLVGVETFANLRTAIRSVLDSDRVETWLNPWQIEHRFTNPMQLDGLVPAFRDLLLELTSLEHYMCQHTANVFYPEGTEEWIGTNIAPLKARLLQTLKDTEMQLAHGARVKDYDRPLHSEPKLPLLLEPRIHPLEPLGALVDHVDV